VAVAPLLHLANNYNAVCFKAAFPISELKAHRPTYFCKTDSADYPLLKNCHKSFASHPFLIIMCHF